jgi:hypothetical protein
MNGEITLNRELEPFEEPNGLTRILRVIWYENIFVVDNLRTLPIQI